ncbi:ring-1,2-phenylacetyl-CoA epoxidase subunit PaaE [Cohaesibacter marisflavi]|uniref:Ring-1,2-phenylacetyl-CoA epoxidase subunit PaaE n=1 Tax=Cohaesibacter marisflavi TaxID=655353 RepID=A0A1I5KB60_9HYPH|nr:1,2-phenylacetyl-CoA epoxidase subunit PaaE [Cohaesibacter marisflavi]SFO81851.1 ring-1,2-phenylacetyl-CoA epoxidase subunit PaaE [Cohaesibacter marisflavi]
MSRFSSLEVTDVRRETRDAVVLTLKPDPADAEAFAFTQGQYLTFRRMFDQEELRRSYSICAGLDEGCLKVGIKCVEGGAFSTWANEELKVGDHIDAMPPAGRFFTQIDPAAEKTYLAFAGGSGITPVLSIIKTVLAREPKSNVTLVYANRQVSSIMFREELEDLKNMYLGRLSVIHILKSEGQEIDLFTGRIDDEKLDALFNLWIEADSVDTAFICGPEPMMLTIADNLRKHGISDEQIKFELFATSQPGRARKQVVSKEASVTRNSCAVSVTLDGATRSFTMPKDGNSILEAAIANNMDAPFSCKAGVCSTCRARVLEGEVEMAVNHALEDYEVKAGYVLSCQCAPVSDKVVLSYDE